MKAPDKISVWCPKMRYTESVAMFALTYKEAQ
jgi:hypothetical protein